MIYKTTIAVLEGSPSTAESCFLQCRGLLYRMLTPALYGAAPCHIGCRGLLCRTPVPYGAVAANISWQVAAEAKLSLMPKLRWKSRPATIGVARATTKAWHRLRRLEPVLIGIKANHPVDPVNPIHNFL